MASFVLPAILYVVIRQLPSRRVAIGRGMLAALVALGIYLACTGICEVAGMWSFVVPALYREPTTSAFTLAALAVRN